MAYTSTVDFTGNQVKATSLNVPTVAATTLTTTNLTTGGISILVGAGAPSASATKGSLYLNTTGSSSSTRLYVNNGTTNWIAVTTAS